jgi:hypothetical protein
MVALTKAGGYGSLAFAGTTQLGFSDLELQTAVKARDFTSRNANSARVIDYVLPSKRAQGMPGAGCTHSLVRK